MVANYECSRIGAKVIRIMLTGNHKQVNYGFSVNINDFKVRLVRIVLLHLLLRDTGVQVALPPKTRRHHLILQMIVQ